MQVAAAEKIQRAWLPLKIYPVSAGVKGGLAGGVAMAMLAMLYGVIFARSIWYPINLIAGSLYAARAIPSTEALMHFHPTGCCSRWPCTSPCVLLVGLLYGAMLPMLPTRPILWAESSVPCCGRACSITILDFVNPLLDQQINWWWFAASQVAFGVVAGLVVVRQNKCGPRRTCRWPCAPASKLPA